MIRLGLIPWTLAFTLVGSSAFADRDDDDGGDDDEAANVEDLRLTPAQRRTIREIADQAKKEKLRASAELKILGIDLRRELARDQPDERKVSDLIDRLASAEGKTRKARILAGLRVKKLLARDLSRHAVPPLPAVPPVPRAARPPRPPECDERNHDDDDDDESAVTVDPFSHDDERDDEDDGDDEDDSGWLNINSQPFGEVMVDGRRAGMTPLVKLKVKAGNHVVFLKTKKGTQKFQVVIRPGEKTTIVKRFDETF